MSEAIANYAIAVLSSAGAFYMCSAGVALVLKASRALTVVKVRKDHGG